MAIEIIRINTKYLSGSVTELFRLPATETICFWPNASTIQERPKDDDLLMVMTYPENPLLSVTKQLIGPRPLPAISYSQMNNSPTVRKRSDSPLPHLACLSTCLISPAQCLWCSRHSVGIEVASEGRKQNTANTPSLPLLCHWGGPLSRRLGVLLIAPRP